jgi:hypothetical protein
VAIKITFKTRNTTGTALIYITSQIAQIVRIIGVAGISVISMLMFHITTQER